MTGEARHLLLPRLPNSFAMEKYCSGNRLSPQGVS